jgi:hypothetical protein
MPTQLAGFVDRQPSPRQSGHNTALARETRGPWVAEPCSSLRRASRQHWYIRRVDLRFAWNPRKAADNYRKHGVDFVEAATVLGDPLSVTIPDPWHSVRESRWIDIGRSSAGRLLVVVYTETETPQVTRVRLISARVADPDERRAYEEAQ